MAGSSAQENRYPNEAEIVAQRDGALEEGRFAVYYQPQYNHSSGMLMGAEALVRWQYPGVGILPPQSFVPLFEKDGFITRLDMYVFRQVCRFIAACRDRGLAVVPVSVNVSQRDLSVPGFMRELDGIREEYGVPTELLKLELTESAVAGNVDEVDGFLREAHSMGYMVAMDDFGSGMSSLNMLKDLDFDLLKLDMGFLQGNLTNGKGGLIVTSVVRMAKWLGTPVIAEGVETMSRADFMRSIGCDFIQGYLYAKPMPQKEFETRLEAEAAVRPLPKARQAENADAGRLWSPESLETLIFNEFVGSAAIFEYADGKMELLRVNQKYVREMGVNLNEKEMLTLNPQTFAGEDQLARYVHALDLAVETGEEQECETWRIFESRCCGREPICVRSTLRLIGRSEAGYMFFAAVRNITGEKHRFQAGLESEKRLKMAAEQACVYCWEYDVNTREMHPCFRCMRDMGLPAVVADYPEPVIRMGIFPPESADMYRDWHRRIREGEAHLEAVIPLTVGRVPFLVRYTTEFDELGRPVKAYGSATLVVDAEK